MNIDIVAIVLIVVLSGLCYWVNAKLNNIPILKTVIDVVIVVVAVLLLLQSLGIWGHGLHVAIR